MNIPFDPIQRSIETEQVVMRGKKRLYHKFRAAPYYGGIATADAIGCSFLCAFCWNYKRNENPGRFGRLYSPEDVAENLIKIGRRRSFSLFRITGSEPVLGESSFNHLFKVIEIIINAEPHSKFILETNGLMLGYKEGLAQRLNFPQLLVRIALKGVDPGSFEKISGAKKEFFHYPLQALKILEKLGVKAWPALMEDLFSNPQIEKLKHSLQEFGIESELELEYLERYPFVLENLKQRGLIKSAGKVLSSEEIKKIIS